MKHLDNLSSRKQLLQRTDKLFFVIATFAQPENKYLPMAGIIVD